MQLKQFITTEAKNKGYSLETLSLQMGRSVSSLRRTINNGSLSVRDFEKILEILGSKLVIEYNKEKSTITLK
tara:strand:- start:2980 stop:3195 length:216 start_codon:yes stop_codon:yes gene_type:complete